MKNIKRKLTYGFSALLFIASSTALTGCIDEAEMTNGATQEQVNENTDAKENFLLAIPAYLNDVWNDDYAFSFGYGAVMHIRDVQTEEMGNTATATQSYNWFSGWAMNVSQGRNTLYAQFLWEYQYSFLNTINLTIAAIDPESESDIDKGFLGAALAYRAMIYLDMAREYEFLENDVTKPFSPEGNSISGLTVPIVREGMTEEEQRVNPRATKEDMKAFILEDLQRAEQLIPSLTLQDKTLPHLDCVYGLLARYYMWLENYPEAERYAQLAISTSDSRPITESEALNPTTGFNTLSQFMWGSQTTSSSLQSNLVNWTSWMSCEADFGYAPLAPSIIDRNMYDRISDTDWRKLEWKAPAGHELDGRNVYNDAEIAANIPEYGALKFRPGGGDCSDFMVGAATSFPLMRIEEMYFIQAEAAAHQDAARGKQLVEDFMRTNRDPNYSCSVTATDDVVEEIVFQKRVELWGEGQSFFDIKRLNYPVTRGYSGTNHPAAECLNTTTRPAWMNWCIVITEEENNTGVNGYNNPDPSQSYPTWTGQ